MAKARVLIVENEVIIGSDIESVLEKNGYFCVGICVDVRSAEPILRDRKVDLALLDIEMRDGSTYALCDVLAELGIPFAFVSGRNQNAVPESWRNRPFLEKPFTEEGLLETLEGLRNDRDQSTRENENEEVLNEGWKSSARSVA